MIELLIATIICVALDLLLLVRIITGPTAVDRMNASDVVILVTALGLTTYSLYTGPKHLFGHRTGGCALGFIGTIFVSYYLEGRL